MSDGGDSSATRRSTTTSLLAAVLTMLTVVDGSQAASGYIRQSIGRPRDTGKWKQNKKNNALIILTRTHLHCCVSVDTSSVASLIVKHWQVRGTVENNVASHWFRKRVAAVSRVFERAIVIFVIQCTVQETFSCGFWWFCEQHIKTLAKLTTCGNVFIVVIVEVPVERGRSICTCATANTHFYFNFYCFTIIVDTTF
jgi:hypothetical protein